jgi:aspartyl-tRNA(Asn)/glutamyl-tRNA(Gln) amidotransferase subunit A
MDGCAWSLPCHAQGDLPVGLMVSGLAGQDAHLARVALALENFIHSLHP